MLSSGKWANRKCESQMSDLNFELKDADYFLCQRDLVVVSKRGLKRVELKKDQLTLLPFYVIFKSQAAKEVVNSSDNEKRMTGFTINWFVKDVNGAQLTETLPARNQDWQHEAPTPKYQQKLLTEMVQLARHMRVQNTTMAHESVLMEKLVNISILEEAGVCSMGQIRSEQLEDKFLKLVTFVDAKETEGPVTDEDIKTGFELFQAIVYCPSSSLIRLFRFIDGLLSNDHSRTIIQTVVNTFRSGIITDKTTFALAKDFYFVLASTLNLQYENVLLATSTQSQLQEVLDNDWPFFTNNTHLVEKCLKDSDCDGTQEILKRLGKF